MVGGVATRLSSRRGRSSAEAATAGRAARKQGKIRPAGRVLIQGMRRRGVGVWFERIYAVSSFRGLNARGRLSRMARADGGEADAGAVHGAGMALRAQARRHPPARVQE